MELDGALWSTVLGQDAAAMTQAVGVVELSGKRLTTSQLMQLLASEFERTLGEPASEDELLPSETKMATALAEEKYASPEWNVLRRPVAASIR
jgi:lipoate-protein ligase A